MLCKPNCILLRHPLRIIWQINLQIFEEKNVINQIFEKIYQTKYSFQNVDTFASSRGKIIIFRSKMKRKWIFTFQNDKNVHWHGKDHCAMLIILDYLATINFKMGAIWPVEILLSTLSWDLWPGDKKCDLEKWNASCDVKIEIWKR